MNKNEKLSRIIEYKGTLDISQIVANFKRMQQELRGRGTKESDILNLEGEIQKIQTLDKAIQKMIGKGFKTPKEFAEFDKLTSQMNRSIEQLNEQFRRTDAKSLADSLKQAQNHTKRLRTNTDELEKAYSSYLKDVLKNNEAKADITRAIKSNIQNAKEQKTLEYDISKIIQDEIKKQEQKIKNDEIALQKQKNLLQTYQNQREALKDITNFSFSEQINGKNKNFKNNFLNRNNYKQSDGSAITDEQMQKITNTLNTMFSKKTLPDMDKFVNSLKNSGIELVNVEGKTKLLTDAYRAYQQQLNNISSREKESNGALKEKQAAIEQAKTALGALNQAYGSGQGDIIGHLQNVLSSINKVIDAETKEKQLQSLQNTPLTGLQQNINLHNRLTTTLEENSNATKAVIKDQQNLDSTFDQIGNRLKYLFSFMNVWYTSVRAIRQTFSDIQKIDKAFGEIAMVTDYSISDMWAQYGDYAEIANDLGQTTESVIKSSALYYQQGLQTNEVLSLTKDTMKLATLANIDFNESTKLMTAALRSFHMEMSEGTHVTDVYSELAANAAANVQEIAYAMSKTSSIAASAGMDFEKLSAMLTVMIEATQEAPSL